MLRKFTLLCLLSTTVASATDYRVGTEVTGQINLGKRSFALSPGKWVVVATGGSQTTGGFGPGVDTKSLYLVHRDDAGRFLAAANFVATVSTATVSAWNDATCDRKDTLFRDTLDGNFKFPACNLINHIAGFWSGGVPAKDYDKAIWTWYRDNEVVLPGTVINTTYVKYFTGDFVQIRYWLNPEPAGIPSDSNMNWNQSAWHPDLIKSHADRLAYFEQVKAWSQSMVKNGRASLFDGKPSDPALPALPGLK